ncbi:MAG TPA: helix-turn-helix transcriptional regulator [Terriglobia bacterium]|nr:helix-turn-helix transcriptional regulator [Terriglobia bacterium]
MVKYEDAALDRVFAALADPTRRALLAQLRGHDGVAVSDLAKPFPVSLPAVMKHLDVLAAAGLITRAKTGRTVACRLTAAPMEQAMTWLAFYQAFWSGQLDRLAAFVEAGTCKETQKKKARTSKAPAKAKKVAARPGKGPASPSPGTSKRRRNSSTRPGPTREK